MHVVCKSIEDEPLSILSTPETMNVATFIGRTLNVKIVRDGVDGKTAYYVLNVDRNRLVTTEWWRFQSFTQATMKAMRLVESDWAVTGGSFQ